MNQCGKGAGREVFFQFITVSQRQASACNLSWSIRIYLSVPQSAKGMLQISKSFYPPSLGPKEKMVKAPRK